MPPYLLGKGLGSGNKPKTFSDSAKTTVVLGGVGFGGPSLPSFVAEMIRGKSSDFAKKSSEKDWNRYGLKVTARHPDFCNADSVVCLFCITFGREEKVGANLKPTSNINYWKTAFSWKMTTRVSMCHSSWQRRRHVSSVPPNKIVWISLFQRKYDFLIFFMLMVWTGRLFWDAPLTSLLSITLLERWCFTAIISERHASVGSQYFQILIWNMSSIFVWSTVSDDLGLL